METAKLFDRRCAFLKNSDLQEKKYLSAKSGMS